MILIIDNYDSFTFNLYQMIGQINPEITIVRNDALTVTEVAELNPSHVIISPGPGYPKDAGICIDLVTKLAGRFPILGVCLGHQSICEAYGARITHAQTLMHGKSSVISTVAQSPLFRGIPTQFEVGRYHSLACDPSTLPEELVVTALADDGEIQAVEHRDLPLYGVQFHPESVLTPLGARILNNFITQPLIPV